MLGNESLGGHEHSSVSLLKSRTDDAVKGLASEPLLRSPDVSRLLAFRAYTLY
jgi:hypothetical protein